VSTSADVHVIAARVHGRYLVDAPSTATPLPMLVGFHGYGERAEDMLDVLRRIRGERAWLLVSVHALHRFYTKAQTVVGSWMTREDRELAIADNIAYVASVVAAVRAGHQVTDALVYTGFSQGVAMAYRAAASVHEHVPGVPRPAGLVVLAGDVPPDVVPSAADLPAILLGRGTQDEWYTEVKANADLAQLSSTSVPPEVLVFDGGHVWDASFVRAAGAFLDRTIATTR
jgi:predicted esterase